MAEFAFTELTLADHRCWPAASVIGRSSIAPRIEIAVAGKGRHYFQFRPAGFWRDFLLVRPDDDLAVLDWINRKGDPGGKLAPDTPVDTGSWPGIANLLVPLDRLWSEPDAAGFSRVIGSNAAIERELQRVERETGFWRGLECRPVASFRETGTLSMSLAAKTLGDFLICSAAFNLATRAVMKRCEHCADHFVPSRSDARFCSATCRTAALQTAKATGQAVGQAVAAAVGSVVVAATGLAVPRSQTKKK